jgi:lipid A 4'-phosphatase
MPRTSPHTSTFDTEAGPQYRLMRICLAALIVASLLFFVAPGLDIAMSRLFYAPGRGFFLADSTPVVTIRNLGIYTTTVTCVGLVVLALWWRLIPAAQERWHNARPWADWMFLTAGMALGPGVLSI